MGTTHVGEAVTDVRRGHVWRRWT